MPQLTHLNAAVFTLCLKKMEEGKVSKGGKMFSSSIMARKEVRRERN